MRYPSTTRFLRLLICLSACLLALPATLHAGTVKVATNLSHTHYFAQQNTFANLLLNFLPSGGTLGVDLTDDGVSKRGGGSFFDYEPTAHFWPDSTDDPATWYKLSYHCDADSGKNYVSVTGGFTVVKLPLSDGKGNWTSWLSFNESALHKSGNRVRLGINYAEDDRDKDGLAKHPISRIKLLYPGCTDDDFLSPVFKQRAGGYCRFRFCDPMYMNGRRVSCGLDVPGTSNTYEREGKGILRAVNAPGNVQTQTYVTPQQGWFHNMSWGKCPGAGNHMTVWTGKKYEEVSPGIGCLAPCELEYELGGRFFLFRAQVGIDHEVDNGSTTPHGNVTFQVWAATVAKPGPNDYKLLKEVKNLTSTSWETILMDVTGVARLKLKMLDNGDPNGHVDIHNPSLYFYQRWSDRTLPRCIGSDGQGTFREGLPYEYAMRICNDLNADIWINMPCTADNDYVEQFANLMLYGSDPAGKVYTAAGGANPRPANPPAGSYSPLKKGLSVWMENDNECWYWFYESFQYYFNKGAFNHRDTYQQFAVDLKRMSDILKPRFAAAGRAADLKVVFCGQINGGWGDHEADKTLAYMEKQFGPVSGYFDFYAEAPYAGTGPAFGHDPKPKTLDEIFMYHQEFFETKTKQLMPSMARRAAKWKLGVTTYEGGLGWEGGTEAVHRKGKNSRRMGLLYDTYLQAWQTACGPSAIYQEYTFCSGYPGDGWPFHVLQYCGEALKGSVCYDALMRNSHVAGDCNLDGKVTYADFKILAANFGGDGEKNKRWWSQGDFNNDQVVGLDDLKLLLMNTDLNAWTAAQRQELNAFLAAHPGPYVLGPDPKTRQGTWMLKTWRNHTKGLMLPVQEDSGGKPSRFMVRAEPRHGRLDVSAFPTIRYAPNQDYLGIDDFIVVALDDHNVASNPVWIAMEVAASVDSDVIANFHCDENSGTTMIDTGGNKGELKNTVSWTAGKSKSGLAFSWTLKGAVPTPGYVKLENSPAMDETAYSFSLWVKPEEVPTVQSTGSPEGCIGITAAAGLLVKPEWKLNCSGLLFKADEKESGNGRFVMRHCMWFSAHALEAVSPAAYAPGQWHHLVGVVDLKAQDRTAGQPAKSFGVVWLYVDGKLAGKTYWTGEGEMQDHLKLGKDGGGFLLGAIQPEKLAGQDEKENCRGCFKGVLDEVRIYRRTLSQKEVQSLYQGVVGFPPVIAITTPTASDKFVVGQDVLLQAAASDEDGEVMQVNYYLDAVAPENKLNRNIIRDSPYVFTWKAAKPGTYRLIAAATDDTDLVSASPPLIITVR